MPLNPDMNEFADSMLYIDLDAIVANYNFFDLQTKNTECGAVVKADAYGLGAVPVIKKLFQAGCRKFFVANLDEAIEARMALSEHDLDNHAAIYVFHGVQAWQEGAFLKYNLIPVLNDFYQVKIWHKAAYGKTEKLPAALHFDTGMNRLGFDCADAKKLAADKELLGGINIEFIMSHLANPNSPRSKLNKTQLTKLKEVKTHFPKVKTSIVNSSGCFLGKSYHLDIARPGIGLYGGNSALYEKHKNPSDIKPEDNPIKNVVTLKSKILQIRTIKKGEYLGYNSTFKAKRDSIIATAPIGYGDGYLRSLSGNSHIYIGSKKAPIIGIISMDLITIDITDIPVNKVKIGLEIEILGDNITIDQLACEAGTIGYEILTSFGSRYRRIYLGEV